MTEPRILVCEPIAEDGLRLLRQHARVDVRLDLGARLREAIDGYEGLIVRSQTRVSAEVIHAATRLRVIGRAGVGVDNIDVEAASARGIVVVNAPTAANVAAAEHTLALLLALARHIPQADASVKAGRWERSRFLGVEVRGKTLGIIGLGHIGSEVARRAGGLGMRVIAYDPYVSPEYALKLNVTLVDLDTLLQQSDFLTVHVPLTPATRGLIGARELARTKRGVRIINCARGGIIDEVALAAALRSGQVAGAALDVFTTEPPENSPFITDPDLRQRVVLTPHLGASTEEAQISAAVEVAEQVIAVLQGLPARYAVNAPAILPEQLQALAPYIRLAERLGRLFAQLSNGQLRHLEILYEGEIAEYDTTPLKAAVVKGYLQTVSPEHITLTNALLMARVRGLTVVEHRQTAPAENYANLLTVRTAAAQFVHQLSGTVVSGEPYIVRINQYWVHVLPTEGYLLICYHIDRPGIVGKIGTLLGAADINISFMQVGRRTRRGEAMTVLGLDEPVPEDLYHRLIAEAGLLAAKLVQL